MSKHNRDGGKPPRPVRVPAPVRQASAAATTLATQRSNRSRSPPSQPREDVWITAGLNIVPLNLPAGGIGTIPHPLLSPTTNVPFDAVFLLDIFRPEHITPTAYNLVDLLRQPLMEPLAPTRRLDLLIQKGFVESFLHPNRIGHGPGGGDRDASEAVETLLPSLWSPAVTALFTPHLINPYTFAIDRQIHSVNKQLAQQRALRGELLHLNRHHDLNRSESTLKTLAKRRGRYEAWWNEFSYETATYAWRTPRDFGAATHTTFQEALSPLVRCYALFGCLEENVVLALDLRRERDLKENVAAIFIQEKATPGVYAALMYGLLLDAAIDGHAASTVAAASGLSNQVSLATRAPTPQSANSRIHPSSVGPATPHRDARARSPGPSSLLLFPHDQNSGGGRPAHRTRSAARAMQKSGAGGPPDDSNLPARPDLQQWLGRRPREPRG